MSDVKLTLEPELETPAPGIPTLTLDGVEEEKPVAPEKKEEEQPEVQLTPEEQKVVDDFAEKIDITSSALVMQYGSGAQKKIANFSDTALANVRTKDLGEVGDEIANLVVELKSFDAGEEEKGFLGFFKKQANRLDGMKARYDKAEVNVNKIASSLEGHQVQLMKDIVMLDKLYETNLAYHKELSMYILAGKKRLKRERETTLEELKAKAQRSGLPEDAPDAPTGYVYDGANVLSSSTESYIERTGSALAEACGAEVVVATVDFTDGEDIADYAYDLFNKWGIGDKRANNGLLILLSVGAEDYYAEPGVGLTDVFTGGVLDAMLYDYLEDDFAAKEYDSGVKKVYARAVEILEDHYNVSYSTGTTNNANANSNYNYANNNTSGGILYGFQRFFLSLIHISEPTRP